MTIYEESRYEAARITPVQGSDGVYRATIQMPLGAPEVGEYTTYRVQAGDRMDLIAQQAYGDPEFWWRIADANPRLPYPDELQPGMLLRIPVLVADV